MGGASSSVRVPPNTPNHVTFVKLPFSPSFSGGRGVWGSSGGPTQPLTLWDGGRANASLLLSHLRSSTWKMTRTGTRLSCTAARASSPKTTSRSSRIRKYHPTVWGREARSPALVAPTSTRTSSPTTKAAIPTVHPNAQRFATSRGSPTHGETESQSYRAVMGSACRVSLPLPPQPEGTGGSSMPTYP